MITWRSALAVLAGAGLSIVAAASAFERDTDMVDVRAVERLAEPPLGLPPALEPGEPLPSPELIALGRKLFFDRRLSHNGTMSCGMCHVPEQGFTSNEMATAVGIEGRSLLRNAPTILNVAYQRALFHDGREPLLETQVIAPLIAEDEMANPSVGYLIEKVASLPDYEGLFEAALGDEPSIAGIGAAIAAWQRSMLAGDSPFDRWYFGGDEDAVGAEAKRGYRLFVGEAGCVACHSIGEDHALFTDQSFHDTGIGYFNDVIRPQAKTPVAVEIAPGVKIDVLREVVASVGAPPMPDRGRYEVTRGPADLWRFKTPSLRNVALTAPYMHDGSLPTLEALVRFYDRGGHPSPGLDPRVRPLGLSEGEIAALVAFLESLTSTDIADLVADARSAPIGD